MTETEQEYFDSIIEHCKHNIANTEDPACMTAYAKALRLLQDDEVPADDLLYVLELVQDYCKDVRSGSYRVEPGEIPLQKIGDIITIGKSGSIRRPKEESDGDEATG